MNSKKRQVGNARFVLAMGRAMQCNLAMIPRQYSADLHCWSGPLALSQVCSADGLTVGDGACRAGTGESCSRGQLKHAEIVAEGPEDSDSNQLDSSGREGPELSLVEWFLEQAIGPKIPIGHFAFCPGAPTRLGPRQCQYEAYWNGYHVAVIAATDHRCKATRGFLKAFAKNVNLLRGIDHPCFVRVYGWCLINRGRVCEPGVVVEWCNFGSLRCPVVRSSSDFPSLTWQERLTLIHDFAEAALYLRSTCHLSLDAVGLESFLVHCTQAEPGRVFCGKIADLSNAR